jgi:hypothetical protein
MWLLHPTLEDHKYFHKFRNVGESTELQDIFWAHPDCIKLFITFPTVLMMDSTMLVLPLSQKMKKKKISNGPKYICVEIGF